jgi:D-aminopeptidase
MIQASATKAVKRLSSGTAPSPYKISEPITVVIEFRLVEMADSASRMPGVTRLDGTRIQFTAQDLATAYKIFQAAVGLAG